MYFQFHPQLESHFGCSRWWCMKKVFAVFFKAFFVNCHLYFLVFNSLQGLLT